MKYDIADESKGRYKNILVSLTKYEALNLIADLATAMASTKKGMYTTISLIEYDRANMGDVLYFTIEDVEQHELFGRSKDEKAKASYLKTVGIP